MKHVVAVHDEVDEMIALGWGDTPRHMIPANWREVPAPCSTCRKRPRITRQTQCMPCRTAYLEGLERRRRKKAL